MIDLSPQTIELIADAVYARMTGANRPTLTAAAPGEDEGLAVSRRALELVREGKKAESIALLKDYAKRTSRQGRARKN